MKRIAVSAVSYTNTLPFLNGIRTSEVINRMDLSVDYPSECGRKVIYNEVDMGIIPVAALTEISDPEIVGDYCIGSDGAVDSVFIFSNKPIHEIETLRLDKQSKTSNGLAQILLKHYWKTDVRVLTDGEADAYVLIGDRTFGQKDKVPFAYDMGYYWKQMTGLPFAYAVWVSNKKLPDDFKKAFNGALAKGVANPEVVIPGLPVYENFDYHKYLTSSLDFHLTAAKRKAIDLYLTLFRELQTFERSA